MKLNTIFRKPVDRPIEGVIKADDSEHLHDEVDEYVLTNEIEKKLEEFLDAPVKTYSSGNPWSRAASRTVKYLTVPLMFRSMFSPPGTP